MEGTLDFYYNYWEEMLMKVIKQGRDEDRMQVTCNRCEAVLEITSADLGHEEAEYMPGTYFYNCPCCCAKHYLKMHEMTRKMREGVCKKLESEEKT